jgi:hypothetical protein
MRQLVHIPIFHSADDLGTLSESVKTHYAKVLGEDAWQKREQFIERFWKHVRKEASALLGDVQHTRIYQDGLPVCGFEETIVRELAKTGSFNHQWIADLLDRGAILEGTENPQLLMEEYALQKQLAAKPTAGVSLQKERDQQAERILKARDAFIADRIDQTLKSGETGLLLLGALHRIEDILAADIQVLGSHAADIRNTLRKTVRRPRP